MSGPRTARSETLIRAVTIISLAFSVVYITWRWGWTLNTEALWFSVPLVMAETYGLVTAFFLAFSAWRLNERRPLPPLRGRTVDVFVTTYDEPLAIIRKTALAAREIRYPHATYILDDGRRDEVRRLAAEIGVSYLTRETNQHAKAGNLNNGLAHSSGEFILQLDADHVPLPQMIDRLIGFFADERVALAQSPQDFYNTDAFTYEVDVQGRRIWEDQQLFFRVLQPGKDRVNAAFFVGSCALVRRAALDEIGGFATGTITEDIETSLLLHGRGWKTVYLNETLAYGLAPSTALAFHVQHLRWGQGAMQTVKRHKPLRMRGLTLAQRLGYLDSLTTYLGGFQRLILYLAPLVFFVTGVFPLEASATAFLLLFVPYLVLQLLSFKLLTRGHGSVLLADRFAMAKFFTHVLAITGYTTRRKLGFRVTPKEAGRVPTSVYAPQALLIAATVAALGFAVYERTLGVAPEEVPGWGAVALWVNVAYALWNAAVAAYIVRVSLGGHHRRVEHRFAEALAVTLRIMRSDGKLSAYDIAITDNLNPHGAALRCMHRIEEGSRVEMVLPLHWRDVAVRGRMVHHAEHATPYGTVHVHGVEFDGLDAETRDAIELHCAQHATPMERQRYQEGAGSATGFRRLRNLRQQPRLAVGMPVRIIAGNNGATRSLGVGLLEDVSPVGARMLLDHPVAPGSMLRLEVPGSELTIEGRVVFVHALETSVGVRFVAGLETPAEAVVAGTDPHWLDGVLASAVRYRIAAVARASAVGETVRRTVIAAIANTRVAAPEAQGASDGQPVPAGDALPAPASYPTLAEVVAAAELLSDEAKNDLPVTRYDIVEAAAVPLAEATTERPAPRDELAGAVDDAAQVPVGWSTAAMRTGGAPLVQVVAAAGPPETSAPVRPVPTVDAPYEIQADGIAVPESSDDATGRSEPGRGLEADVMQYQPISATVDVPELGNARSLEFDPISATVNIPELESPRPLEFDPISATVNIPELESPRPLEFAPISATVTYHEITVPELQVAHVSADVRRFELSVPALHVEPVAAAVQGHELSLPALHYDAIEARVEGHDLDVPEIHLQPIEVSVAGHDLHVPEIHLQPIEASVEGHDLDVPEMHLEPIDVSVGAPELLVSPLLFDPITVNVEAPDLYVPSQVTTSPVSAFTSQGDPSMQTATFGSPARPTTQSPAILAIRGGSARLEGKFDIEESIEVQCELSGELTVGGTMIIGESGTVSADVKTVNAIILGTYNGNLVASGSIEIAASGRVSGTLESNELVIAKGGIFTGSVARSSPPAQPSTAEAAREQSGQGTAEETSEAPAAAAPAAAAPAEATPAAPAPAGAAEPEPVFARAEQQATLTERDDFAEVDDITAIGPISELDDTVEGAAPVVPPLADRAPDDAKARGKQSARLQSITLS